MRKELRIAASVSLVVVACSALLISGAYIASQHVPSFYDEALVLDSSVQTQASEEMESRASALYNDVRRQGEWQALFSADQINGWMAVDLARDHPELFSGDIQEPRVSIQPECLSLGFRMDTKGISTVFSVDVGIYLAEPNVIACQIYSARAGALPLPLKSVLDQVSATADKLDIPLRWRQSNGDPVALLTIVPGQDQQRRALHLEKLELLEGEIYLAGRSEPSQDEPSQDATELETVLAPQPAVAGQPSANTKRQR